SMEVNIMNHMQTSSPMNPPTEPRRLLPGAARITLCAVALLPALAMTSGCVVAVRPAPAAVVYTEPQEVVVTELPPAPVAEYVGAAPGPGFIWIGGYYHWSGVRWVWFRGHYE